jgi:hypothetical protein
MAQGGTLMADKCNHSKYIQLFNKAMNEHKITDRPITSPGGGTVTLDAGEAVVEERRRHVSRRENSTLAISVATHSGRSGIAHVIMNRSDSIMCCKRHQENCSTTHNNSAQDSQNSCAITQRSEFRVGKGHISLLSSSSFSILSIVYRQTMLAAHTSKPPHNT